MKKYYLFAIMFIAFGGIIQAQTADSISMMLANPETNQKVLKQAMNSYVQAGGQLDSHLLKVYERSEAFYGAYTGIDGSENNFYPAFLPQSSAPSQSIPNINGCALPTKPYNSIGPKFLNDNVGHNGRLTSIAIDTINNIVYAGSENGGLWKKPIGTDDWVNITDNLGFPALGINDIAIHPTNPDTIYCATGQHKYQGMTGYGIGVIHSYDGGNTWYRDNVRSVPKFNKEALSVAFTPFAPYTIFAGLGNNLYRYNGSTWDSIYTTNPGDTSKYLEIVRDIKFVTPKFNTQPKILISTHVVSEWADARLAIANLNSQNNISSIWSVFSTHDSLSTGDTLMSHLDGTSRRMAIDVSKSDSQTIYVSYSVDKDSRSDIEIMRSLDYGLSWDSVFHKKLYNVDNPPDYSKKISLYLNDISISLTNDNVYYNATVRPRKSNYNLLTTDDWIPLGTIHDDIRDIEIIKRNGQEEIWMAHDGGLHRSTDGGTTWILEHKNMVIAEYYDVGISERHNGVLAGALDNRTHINKSNNWKLVGSKSDGSPALFLKGVYSRFGLYTQNGTVYRYDYSTDSSISKKYRDPGSSFWLEAPIINHPYRDDMAYIGQRSLYQYSEISGLQTITTFQDNKITAIAVSSQNDSIMYVTNDKEWSNYIDGSNIDSITMLPNPYIKTLRKTINKGSTWMDISNYAAIDSTFLFDHAVNASDIIVSPSNHDYVYMSLEGMIEGHPRVVYSDNGGLPYLNDSNSWVDITGNLPFVAVHELEILDSYPNDFLLAATDLGVYIKELGVTSSWECFNNGLPPSVIKNFEIRYCSQELYVATHGHGIYKADISELLGYQDETIDVGTTVNWTTDQTFYNDIVIAENATLNITGATISMGANAKIIVKEGAVLNLDNSTITSYCNAFWSGIEVWGNSQYTSSTQYCPNGASCLTGKLTMTNSTLQYAENAVRLWKPNDWNKIGGMIFASHSTFLNNRRDVEFMAYENHFNYGPNAGNVAPYRSRFNDCTFEVDSNYLFDVKPPQQARVSMWKVRGIKFNGCAFKNSTGEIQNLVGIGSLDANYSVKQYCNGIYPCATPIVSTFTGLKAGICATGSGENYSFTVDNATFTDNEYGVLTASVNEAVITRNTFTPYVAGVSNYDLLHLNTTAIHMEVSDDYTIQENTITGIQPGYALPGQPPLVYNTRGIALINSGANNNKVYKNTLSYLNQANIAYGLNANPIPGFENLGLQYECNGITQSVIADINIYGPNAGIAINQGALNDAADNTFSASIQTLTGHINNNSFQPQPLNYYYHSNQTGYNFEPTMISNSVITHLATGDITFVENQSCKTKLPTPNQGLPGKLDGVDVLGEWLKASNGKNGYYQAKYVYTALVDGGDTYGLLNTVQNTNSQTAWDIRTDLINASPISIEVVNQTIDDAFLSNALLHDVLMVNPHAVRDEGVMYKLENKTNPMPAYMINTLLGIYEAQTQKDILEAEMGNQMQKAFEAARFLQWNWQADTNKPINDSVLALMDTLNTPAAEWVKVAHQFSKGNYGEGQVLINAMPSKFTFNTYENDVYTELSSYYTTYTSMLNAGPSSFTNPTPAQLTNLQTLAADTTTKAGRMAQNLVLFAENKLFWPTLPAAPQNKKEEKNPRAKRSEVATSIAKVYPNPANGYVTIAFTQLESKQAVYISVINNIGTQVLSHNETMNPGGLINLATQNLASGQYFVLIYSGDKLLQKQAIEIVH